MPTIYDVTWKPHWANRSQNKNQLLVPLCKLSSALFRSFYQVFRTILYYGKIIQQNLTISRYFLMKNVCKLYGHDFIHIWLCSQTKSTQTMCELLFQNTTKHLYGYIGNFRLDCEVQFAQQFQPFSPMSTQQFKTSLQIVTFRLASILEQN